MNSQVKVVQPQGILDSTKSTGFRQDISILVQEQVRIILVDFENVTFMDSSGLGALVQSLKTVRAAGAQIFLCSINDQIRMLFELTSMDRVFEIFEDREEFERKKLESQLIE